MPIHDWTRVRANRFHHFHQNWMIALSAALNAGRLPPGYFALVEQKAGGPEPDVLALELDLPPTGNGARGSAVLTSPPQARFIARTEAAGYALKADRLTVRHPDGDVVAVIEIVSPGNKDSRHALDTFADKAAAFLRAGIHVLIVDLFPPNKRNPQGIHPAIWERFCDEPFALPADKPLTIAAYRADAEIIAYVEPVAVGDALPELPIFLSADTYIPCPLESTYLTAWELFPPAIRGPLELPSP